MISDFLFPETSAPKIIFQRIRAHASMVVSLSSWERGDTMRNLQAVSIDHYKYPAAPEGLQPDLPHLVLVAGVCKSKELIGDKQRVCLLEYLNLFCEKKMLYTLIIITF